MEIGKEGHTVPVLHKHQPPGNLWFTLGIEVKPAVLTLNDRHGVS